MSDDEQDLFLVQAKRALDDCEARTPPDVKHQLDAIRQQAMQHAEQPQTLQQKTLRKASDVRRQPWVLWPLGGVAAAVLVVMFWVADPQATHPGALVDDLELLAMEDDLAIVEDIEFLVWLMEQTEGHAG